MTATTNSETAIASVVQHYLDGGIAGSSALMKPAFHEGATIFGYLGPDLIAGPIQVLFDWVDGNPPAPNLKGKIAGLNIAESIATVRLELEDWSGHRFTDMFTLLHTNGEWKIISKVFHLHG
ncbi:MAG: nuclear transport factor 2 family protein [Bryobacter sp.]|nr:nuclear transport factor 2 family protein [Bryobacter sp.]